MIYQDLTQLVGHTPLLSLHRMAAQYEALAQVVAKVESFNPGGSVKERTTSVPKTSAVTSASREILRWKPS